jgi:hypothetical protein
MDSDSSLSRSLEPDLIQMNPDQNIAHFSCKIHFIVIIQSMPRSYKWSPAFRFSD